MVQQDAVAPITSKRVVITLRIAASISLYVYVYINMFYRQKWKNLCSCAVISCFVDAAIKFAYLKLFAISRLSSVFFFFNIFLL